MKSTRILMTLAILISFAFQAEAKKVELKYQLKAGDEFAYTVSNTQEVSQDMMGQTQTSVVTTSTTYVFKVLEVTADGGFRMEGKLTGFATNSNTPNGEMKYNSEVDKEVPEFAKITSLSLNEKYLFTLSPKGVITDAVAPEGLPEKIQQAMGEAGQMALSLSGAGSAGAGTADNFVKTISAFFMRFPDKPVATKKSWTQDDVMDQMVSMQVKTEYTLVKVSGEANEISVASTITVADGAKGMEMEGMTLGFDLSGGKTGTYKLDPKTGLFLNGEGKTNISGVVSIEGAQLPTPMSIPMAMKLSDTLVKK